jgi:hypothetical protein
MPIQSDRRITNAKDLRRVWMQESLFHQRLDARVAFIVGIDANQWLGPKAPRCVKSIDLSSDIFSPNLRK